MIREYVVKVTDALVQDAFQRFENEWSPEQEFVRCRDCKHWTPGEIDEMDNFTEPRCEWHGGGWSSNDYCSYAERK